jgi:hypothetical protein
VFERKESQERMSERKAPKSRILWQNLMEERPRGSMQREYSPSIQIYRASKKLQPSNFFQGRKGMRIFRKKDVSTSAIEHY